MILTLAIFCRLISVNSVLFLLVLIFFCFFFFVRQIINFLILLFSHAIISNFLSIDHLEVSTFGKRTWGLRSKRWFNSERWACFIFETRGFKCVNYGWWTSRNSGFLSVNARALACRVHTKCSAKTFLFVQSTVFRVLWLRIASKWSLPSNFKLLIVLSGCSSEKSRTKGSARCTCEVVNDILRTIKAWFRSKSFLLTSLLWVYRGSRFGLVLSLY